MTKPPAFKRPPKLPPFQIRVHQWIVACFGNVVAFDKTERADRFLEESLELVQSTGYTAERAHQLVDYVFGRPAGDVQLEVGGVMICLAALCTANLIQMDEQGEIELERIWDKIDQIQEKWKNKPKFGPLPQQVASVESTKPIPPFIKGRINTAFADMAQMLNMLGRAQKDRREVWEAVITLAGERAAACDR